MDNRNDRKERSPEDLLTELANELQQVHAQTASLRNDIKRALEEHWWLAHQEIFPRMVLWAEKVGARNVSTVRINNGAVTFEPTLSEAELPFKTSHFDVSLFSTLDSVYAPGMAHCARTAMASHEAQLDFHMHLGAVPFCLFDNVISLFLCSVPTLKKEDYGTFIAHTEKLLRDIRGMVLKGEWTQHVRYSKAE